jgi:hypothetical protein
MSLLLFCPNNESRLKNLKISTIRKSKFGKTSEIMGGLCFVIFVTGLNSHNTSDENDIV